MAQTWWIEKRMSFADHVLVVWADRHRVARWWVVGLVFTVLNIPVIYFLVDVLLLPLAAATVIAGEIGLLARFLESDSNLTSVKVSDFVEHVADLLRRDVLVGGYPHDFLGLTFANRKVPFRIPQPCGCGL